MRKIYSLLVAVVLLSAFSVNAQVTVTNPGNTTPGLSATYPTLAAAITDLNLQTAISGQVVITLSANETAPVGGYAITDEPAGISATKNIIIDGGSNTVMASGALTAGSVNDAIFKIIGADYITIRNFTMQENPSNATTATASNNMTEFGVALFYSTTTDGAQNNTIQNNTITLNRAYQNSFGIYSNTQSTATAVNTSSPATSAAGANSNNKVYSNQISNVNYAIYFTGSTTVAAMDNGNDIGGTSASTGNTISNWGNTTVANTYVSYINSIDAAVYLNQQLNDNASFNTITSAALTNSLNTYGILTLYYNLTPTGVTTVTTVNNNTITITNNSTATTTGSVIPINTQGMTTYLATATVNVNNNTISGCTLGGATSTTAGITCIANSCLAGVVNMNGNSLINNSIVSSAATSAVLAGVSNSGAANIANLNNNILYGFVSKAASGQMQGIINSGNVITAVNITGNQLGNTSGGYFSSTVNSSGNLYGVYTAGSSATCTHTIQNNDIQGISYTGTAPTAAQYYVYAVPTSSSAGLNILNNTFTSLSIKTTGSLYMVYNNNSVNTFTVNNNKIVTSFARTLAGLTYGYYDFGSPSGGTATITNNDFSNITLTGASNFYGIRHYTSTTQTEIVNNNTVSNVSGGSTSAVYGISHGYGAAGSTVNGNTVFNLSGAAVVYGINLGDGTASLGLTCSGNKVYTLSSTGASGVYGIYNALGTSTTIVKNKIYDLSGNNASGTVNGIAVPSGTTVTLINNLVGDLRETAANAANPVIGLNITAGTTVNAYFNTVYLAATSSGAIFGSSALSVANGVGFTSINNILVNNSVSNSTGLSAVYRRSTAATTNYNAASNNNLFYAATGVVYYDGTTSYATFPAYKTYIATRDQASISENPNFLSTVGSSAAFLHINPAIATQIESGGKPVSGITDDYDGDTRNVGTPDIGADEFAGTTPAPAITNVTVPTGTCTATAHVINADVTTASGTITSVTLNYNNGSAGSVAMTLVSGNTYTGTIPAASPTNATVTFSITAINSLGFSTSFAGSSYTDDPLNIYTVTSSANPTTVCAGTPAILTATVNVGGTATTYTNPTAVTNAVTDEDLGNITITQGATTVLNNTTAINSLAGTIGTATGTAGSYSNFTAFGPYTLTASTTYNFSASSLQATTAYGNAIAIYIDYNRNGSFADPGEEVYNQGATIAGAHTVTGSFTVPATLTPGLARMRVIVNEGTISGPNITVGYGEFEDYAIRLLPVISYTWSDGASTVGSGNPLTVNPPVGTTTYTPSIIAFGCTKAGTGVVVTGTALPAAPTDASIPASCGAPTFTAASGATSPTFNFYSAATGGTLLATNTTGVYTATSFVVGSNSVYVTVTSGGCTSNPRTQLTVISSVAPPVTLSQTGTVYTCVGYIQTLTASSLLNYYTIYSWSPTANLYQDPAATVPYTGQNLSTVYYKRTTITAGETITVTGSEMPALCSNTANVTFVVSQVPTVPTITASATSVCSGFAVTLTANTGSATYCAPPTYSNPGATGDYIGNVTFAGINNTTGDVAADYTYYTTPSATVTGGTGYPISLLAGGTAALYSQQFGVWIDYNQNGIFEASEFVFNTTAGTYSPTAATGTIVIPTSAFNGVTRMRIISQYGTTTGVLTSGQGCAAALSFGETEDYNITISGATNNPSSGTIVWSDGTTTVGTGTSIVINPTVTHTYTATVTNAGNCSATSAGITVTIVAPLNGVYSVGTGNIGGEAGHYATLTAAVADYNTVCIGGPVTFALTDATYSSAETFPITINANAAASSTKTLTIKPNTGVTATITGAVASGSLLIVKNNYTTIDGSNGGTSSQNLSIINSSVTTPSILQISSTGTTPVINTTVKNTLFVNGINSSTAAAVFIGDAALGTAGYFNNITFQNNSIQKAYNGLYVYGASLAGNGSGLLITGNNMTGTGTNAIVANSIYLYGVDGSTTISNNTLSNNTNSAFSANVVGINLAAGTNNCAVTGNTISNFTYSGGSSYLAEGIYVTSITGTAINIANNTITGITSNGISNQTSGIWSSSPNTTIANNSISAVSQTAAYTNFGIFVNNLSGTNVISGNTISNITGSGAATVTGICLQGTTAGVSLFNNKVTNIKNTNTSGYGAYGMQFSSSSTTANTKVYNNFISNVAGYGATQLARNGYGIAINGGAGYTFVYNSINMNTEQTAATGTSADFLVTAAVTTAGALTVEDNIFSSDQTIGNTYTIYSGAANSVYSVIDYNDYYYNGNNIAYIGGAAIGSFGALQTATGQDVNSQNIQPVFVSGTDLHLIPASNQALNDLGTPLPSVTTTDIDGDTRPTPPSTGTDMGADEFTPPLGLDVGVTALTAPPVKSCYTNAEQVTVTIKNFSVNPINFSANDVLVTVNVTGAVTQTLTATVSTGTLASNTTLSVPVGTLDMSAPGTYTFNAFTSISSGIDVTPSNDALTPAVTRTVVPVTAGTASSSPSTICVSGTPTLSLTGSAGGTIQWQESTSATGPWTNVGTNSVTYIPATPITVTMYYRAVVSCATSVISNVVTVTVNNPQVVTTTPGTRCGTGTVSLGATVSSGNTPVWYAASSGGTSLYTGSPFVTPVISGNTTYYVAAQSSGAPLNATFGTGTGTNSITAYPAPYSVYYGGAKHQMLLLASELTAQGLSAGSKITSVSMNVTSVGTTFPGNLLNFEIDMGQTATAALTSTSFVGGLSQVYGPLTQPIPTTGLPQTVTHTLSTPFIWNGTSNIVIQTSFSNNISGSSTDGVTMTQSTTSAVQCNWYRADAVTAAAILSAPTPTNSSTSRPNLVLGIEVCTSARTAVTATVSTPPALSVSTTSVSICAGTPSAAVTLTSPAANYDTYTISPSTGVSGTAATGYIFNPAATTTYTLNATQTSGSFCANSVTITVTVNPAPTPIFVSPTSASICSSATSGQAITATGGAVNNTYINESFSSGTTFPSGWSTVVGSGDAITVNASNSAGGTANEVRIVGNSQTANITDRVIYGPFSSAGTTSLQLSWKNYVYHYSSTYIYSVAVQTSTDGVTWHATSWGTSPVTASIGPGTQTTTINNADVGSSTLYISFTIQGMTFGAFDWYIDDVNLTGTAGTYSWSPTTNLYTDAALTTPYTSQNVATVYAKPTVTTPYTVTASVGTCTVSATSTITVTPQPDAVISYTGSPYCAQGTASVSVTGTAGLTGGNYTISGVPGAINSASGAVDLSMLTSGSTYTVTYTVAAAGGCSVYTKTTTLTINGAGGTWLGVNTNWFDPQNWCGNSVPTATTNVVIPTGLSNYPVITTGNALANNISIAGGDSVIVNGTGIFSLYGTNSGAGTFNLAAGTLNLAGAGAIIVPSLITSGTVKNLTMSTSSGGTASIATGGTNMLNVTGNVSFTTSNNTLLTNGNLTFLSSAAGTASLTDITNNTTLTGNSVSGTASVQRYITGQRKWNFLSVNTQGTQTFQNAWMEGQPVGTGTSTGYGLWITDPVGYPTYDNTVVSYSPTIKSWNGTVYTGIGGPASTVLQSSNAASTPVPTYMTFVRGDRGIQSSTGPSVATILRSKGTLAQNVTADVTIPTLGAVTYSSVGNPYPSAVDLGKLSYSTTNIVNLTIWDPYLTGAQGLGAFQTLSGPTTGPFVASPGGGMFDGTHGSGAVGILESGQGFFMQGTATPRNVHFVEKAKASGANLVFFTPGSEQRISGVLSIVGNGVPTIMDGFMSRMQNGFNTAVDYDDARKFSNTGENVSVFRENTQLAIEYRGLLDENDTVFINMNAMRQKTYEWSFTMLNLDQPGRSGWLVDQFNNTQTPLNLDGGNIYDFTVTGAAASAASNRFYIVFRPAGAAGPLPVTFTTITATRQADKSILVSWKSENETNIAHYEVERSDKGTIFTGLNLNSLPLNNAGGSAAYGKTDALPLSADNYYRIKAISNNGQVQYSAIVKVGPLAQSSEITVFPNPLKDRVMNVRFENEPVGAYTLELVNTAGQTIFNSDITLSGSNEVKTISLKKTIAAGSYQLIIRNAAGFKEVKQVIAE